MKYQALKLNTEALEKFIGIFLPNNLRSHMGYFCENSKYFYLEKKGYINFIPKSVRPQSIHVSCKCIS